ncbi:MAG: hypothetical protein EA422_14325 [Gemmatimonadales bacterium]|nr:MAG: hypothetical protein EA422_14325 [Gemmatimonadales bacterium]
MFDGFPEAPHIHVGPLPPFPASPSAMSPLSSPVFRSPRPSGSPGPFSPSPPSGPMVRRRSPVAALRFVLVAPVLALILAGCFSHQVVDPAAVAVGDDVRVRITEAEAQRLAPTLQRESRVLQGRIADIHPALFLDVVVHSEVQGAAVRNLRQRVEIPTASLLEMERRALDRRRTGLLVGAGVGIVAALVIREFSSDAGGDTRPPLDGGAELRSGPPLRIQR